MSFLVYAILVVHVLVSCWLCEYCFSGVADNMLYKVRLGPSHREVPATRRACRQSSSTLTGTNRLGRKTLIALPLLLPLRSERSRQRFVSRIVPFRRTTRMAMRCNCRFRFGASVPQLSVSQTLARRTLKMMIGTSCRLDRTLPRP
jgi:hypothetical protein